MINKLTLSSRILLTAAAFALIISLFVPVWSIYLDAPQYPEGLKLQIWANAIAGDVDIINGLNHYIGMKTLHTGDFIEFKVLPYLISGFALLFLIVAFLARRRWLYAAFVAFVIFGIVAMADFWKWEYDYGHNLDPNAAIKVPGMAYQPPLIGFKQLLNFGAYSVPAVGGYLFISAGFFLLIAVLLERRVFRSKKKITLTACLGMFFMSSCNTDGPEPITFHKDACDHCRMSISDGRFACELVTQKGRVYKFDDLLCMLKFSSAQAEGNIKKYYIGHYLQKDVFLDATTAWYVRDKRLKSPMNGNAVACATREEATTIAAQYQTAPLSWQDLVSTNTTQDEHQH